MGTLKLIVTHYFGPISDTHELNFDTNAEVIHALIQSGLDCEKLTRQGFVFFNPSDATEPDELIEVNLDWGDVRHG